eukprot:30805-Pelagococcus_subviridis.AAC.13
MVFDGAAGAQIISVVRRGFPNRTRPEPKPKPCLRDRVTRAWPSYLVPRRPRPRLRRPSASPSRPAAPPRRRRSRPP